MMMMILCVWRARVRVCCSVYCSACRIVCVCVCVCVCVLCREKREIVWIFCVRILPLLAVIMTDLKLILHGSTHLSKYIAAQLHAHSIADLQQFLSANKTTAHACSISLIQKTYSTYQYAGTVRYLMIFNFLRRCYHAWLYFTRFKGDSLPHNCSGVPLLYGM